ncbi:hypothetical protein HZA86_02565 [Candidatus Uhrbacteria bacterium]|nr:hypothetical protein [Candidatus Uhrbacteria bacterium]
MSTSRLARILISTTMLFSLVAAPLSVGATGGISKTILDNVKNSVGEATGQGGTGNGEGGIFPSSNLWEIAYRIIRTFFFLLGLIFLGMMLYGGYNWMTAMGEEEKVEIAKKTITSSIIGIAIIIASYAIVTFVINSVYNTTQNGGAGTKK